MTTDPWLRRLQRHAALWCAAAAGVALLVPGGGWRAAAAVAGGGLLSAISFFGIKAGADALVSAATRQARGRIAWALTKFLVRYALLGFLAYVMIARLRLPPIALLAGASSLVVAAAVEAVRTATKSHDS